jgi:acylphosphatase
MDQDPTSAAVCKRVVYSGRVQGVGFRYAAQHLAEHYPVAGFVRNLANGNVELLAQGAREAVDEFLQSVARRMADYVETATVQEEESRQLKGFRIRY